jgi:DNA invertase Pin-like site-specific DNA recombinase
LKREDRKPSRPVRQGFHEGQGPGHRKPADSAARLLRRFRLAHRGEYIDRATGKHSDREQFKAMFTAASRREFDLLVTWALDRLSREGVAKTFEHIKVLRGYRVQYVSYSEPHFRTTGPAGELMIAVAAWIDAQEHQRISARTKAGLAKARRQGRIGGRRRLVIDYDRIAELDESGLTMREIAAEMGVSPAFICRALKARHRRASVPPVFGD